MDEQLLNFELVAKDPNTGKIIETIKIPGLRTLEWATDLVKSIPPVPEPVVQHSPQNDNVDYRFQGSCLKFHFEKSTPQFADVNIEKSSIGFDKVGESTFESGFSFFSPLDMLDGCLKTEAEAIEEVINLYTTQEDTHIRGLERSRFVRVVLENKIPWEIRTLLWARLSGADLRIKDCECEMDSEEALGVLHQNFKKYAAGIKDEVQDTVTKTLNKELKTLPDYCNKGDIATLNSRICEATREMVARLVVENKLEQNCPSLNKLRYLASLIACGVYLSDRVLSSNGKSLPHIEKYRDKIKNIYKSQLIERQGRKRIDFPLKIVCYFIFSESVMTYKLVNWYDERYYKSCLKEFGDNFKKYNLNLFTECFKSTKKLTSEEIRETFSLFLKPHLSDDPHIYFDAYAVFLDKTLPMLLFSFLKWYHEFMMKDQPMSYTEAILKIMPTVLPSVYSDPEYINNIFELNTN